jgi:hypothetical protein
VDIKINKKRIVYICIALIIFTSWILSSDQSFNEPIPAGKSYKSHNEINNDLNYIFQNEIEINSVDIVPIDGNDDIYLPPNQKSVFSKYYDPFNSYDKLVISLSNKSYFSNDGYDNNGLDLVNKYSIKILDFISKRKLPGNIKIVFVIYSPKSFLGVPPSFTSAIPLNEYLELEEDYKKKGLSKDEVMNKLHNFYRSNASDK